MSCKGNLAGNEFYIFCSHISFFNYICFHFPSWLNLPLGCVFNRLESTNKNFRYGMGFVEEAEVIELVFIKDLLINLLRKHKSHKCNLVKGALPPDHPRDKLACLLGLFGLHKI